MSTSVISAEHETKSGVNDEDYGRTLPFFGDRVRDMGIKLPKPIGISLFTHQQEDLMQLGDFKIDGEPVDDILPNGGSQTTNTTSIVAVRGMCGCCRFGALTHDW
ncbi:hypothetical protein JCM19235_6737 [Vibrio maritimus]|uniref:Uncharacterized protein n=1 Tax=Vibrio maritimus TaxID=990268 RepID=A0A090RVC9_9VIBR|nr:hypothetical protein JCM19235_6737 [Vibrio maritimus]